MSSVTPLERGKVRKVQIADRLVGENCPILIVAEAGVNHNGSIELAKKLIDVAVCASADAVKFQIFKSEDLVTEYAEKAEYQKEATGVEESQYEMLKRMELSEDSFRELSSYAKKKGILFLSSAFDRRSVDLLEKIDVPAYKVPSGEITNLLLLKHVARKGKPILLSTGGSTLAEIEEALDTIRSEGMSEVVLLHCVSSYPARMEDANLRVMKTLMQAFRVPVGFSDHTLGFTVPIAAAALGSCMIEKHFTVDRNLPGPDHKVSLEPRELTEMIRAIRSVEKALGDGVKKPTRGEHEIKKVVRRSVVAATDIARETVVTKGMLSVKRPGTGIPPKDMERIIGKRTRKDIKKNELLSWDSMW